MVQEITIPITGLTIAAKRWGNPAGIPTLALHGWLDNANSFDLIAPLLPHLDLIAIDIPGHGLSSHFPEGCHYHFIDGIIYIYEIINSLGWNKFALLGHSLGAGIAAMAAGTFAEKITHMILIDGFGPLTAAANTSSQQLSQYISSLEKHPAAKIRYYPSLQEAAQVRAKNGYISESLAHIICQRGCGLNEHGYYWRHDRKLLHPTPLRLTEGQVIAFIHKISAPTCLIVASHGYKYDSKSIKRRLDAIHAISIHKLTGGHHIHMEKPEKVAEIIKEFIKS